MEFKLEKVLCVWSSDEPFTGYVASSISDLRIKVTNGGPLDRIYQSDDEDEPFEVAGRGVFRYAYNTEETVTAYQENEKIVVTAADWKIEISRR